jgi:hypothetical protein
MTAKLASEDGKARYKKRKQTVKPVFGIIKSAIGFTRFHRRGLANGAAESLLVVLAYNCRRVHRLPPACAIGVAAANHSQLVARPALTTDPNPTACYSKVRSGRNTPSPTSE